MIPPIVQPGDEFQRVRMPNSAGLAGEALSIASVNGDLAQLEWVVSMSAIYARTTDPLVAGQIWNDGSYLRFSAGPVSFSPSLNFSDARNSQYLALFRPALASAYASSTDFSNSLNSQYIALFF